MVGSLYEPNADAFVQTGTENPIVGSNVSSLQKIHENLQGMPIWYLVVYDYYYYCYFIFSASNIKNIFLFCQISDFLFSETFL